MNVSGLDIHRIMKELSAFFPTKTQQKKSFRVNQFHISPAKCQVIWGLDSPHKSPYRLFDHKLVNEIVNEIVNKNLEDRSSVPSENLAILLTLSQMIPN